jgi:lipid A 4'-phosphatase
MTAAATYLLVFILAFTLFLIFPQIDLLVSRLFYAPGSGFALKNWPPVELLYHIIPWIVIGIALVIIFGIGWLFLVGRPLWRLDRKALCFLALSTALGPGILVNTILKDHWGRARPMQVELFGGTRHFTPAPLAAAECSHNCSFASGHAALGFSLVAFAFLLPAGPARRRGIAATLGFGMLIGLTRIAQGAHFLSDVVYAGLFVYGTAAALHWWVVDQDGLAVPALQRLYRTAGHAVSVTWPRAYRIWKSPPARLGISTAIVAAIVIISIETADRPLAFFFHAQGPDTHSLFEPIGRFGIGYGWLTGFGVGFVVLHWGGNLPRLRPFGRRLRAWSAVPAFLFASVAASGIAADILKVVFGRARPKLLFNSDLYGFAWLGWHADYWSFPSGHAATIVSVLTGLWYLWPSHILFYIVLGTLVAMSRVVIGAHFLSDAVAGAWLAMLTTRCVVACFASSGIDLAGAHRAQPSSHGRTLWICRRFRGIVPVADDLDAE